MPSRREQRSQSEHQAKTFKSQKKRYYPVKASEKNSSSGFISCSENCCSPLLKGWRLGSSACLLYVPGRGLWYIKIYSKAALSKSRNGSGSSPRLQPTVPIPTGRPETRRQPGDLLLSLSVGLGQPWNPQGRATARMETSFWRSFHLTLFQLLPSAGAFVCSVTSDTSLWLF